MLLEQIIQLSSISIELRKRVTALEYQDQVNKETIKELRDAINVS